MCNNIESIKPLTDFLDSLDEDQLYELQLLLCTENLDLDKIKRACKIAIRRKRDVSYVTRPYNSLNRKFTIKYMLEWGIITRHEYDILSCNRIRNLRDLLKCNLSDLDGSTPSLIVKLEEVRRFYDMREYCDLETAKVATKKKVR